MYDEDQDVDDLDRLLVCPYESSHKVTASRMNHHLVKCRKNYYVTEKTICPFNEQHVIFEQEIATHKILCPDGPDSVTDEDEDGDEKRQENNVETEETKAHTNCDSDLQTDKAIAETGCINGLKVGGLKDYNIDSTNEDVQETVMALHSDESTVNGETQSPQENGAKCDLEDVSLNAVSHMAGFEPQDDNIAIEKQLSQSKGNLSPSSENGDVNDETTVNGQVEEHFDYKKYAPSKEEREEFLKLIKEHKEDQNGVDDKDETCYPGYIWQGYTYIQPYHPNQSYPGMYGPGAAFIAYPNGTYHAVNGQYPAHYAFQPGSGPVPQYVPPPVQGYDYNHGYTPRQHYRRPYRGRNHYHNNRYHNGYNKHSHYNGHSYNNGHRNHYNHYNGYYSHDTYSHTDTDSNSSASGQSDAGSADMYNGNSNHSDNERPHHHPRRSNHLSRGSVNLERIIHVNTDSDGESGPPSMNSNMLDLSPEPSESFEGTSKRKGEKDKVIRKLRKKLNEIYALENKKNSGVQIDCDQLKKLSRKRELEDELAALTID